MTKSKDAISVVFNTLNYRELAETKIADFPESTPRIKRIEHGAMLAFINAFIESAYAEPKKCRVTVDTPFIEDWYVDQVLDDYRLVPNERMIPSWRSTPISLRLACMHALLSVEQGGVTYPFTVRFREDMVGQAFLNPEGPCRFFHDRIQSELNDLAPSLVWMAYEVSEDGVVHAHGAFHISGDVDEDLIKKALRDAAGFISGKEGSRQLKFSEPIPGRRAEWATYSRKDWKKSQMFFGGDAYSASQELRRAAQKLHESIRVQLNAQRRNLAA